MSSDHSPGNRFGVRYRPYVTHEAKASSLSLMHELGLIWATEFAVAAAHPFRETKSLDADPSMMYMLVHFVIERWREALLWSWAVGKHGTDDDQWTVSIMQAVWKELGGSINTVEGSQIAVKATHREAADPQRVLKNLKASGHRKDDPTTYQFCMFRSVCG
jgi:hypothetical protein